MNTYAIYGMTDCDVQIPVGSAYVRIYFSGGSLCGLGSVPATFTTGDAAIIDIIENSMQYCAGKIVKVK